MFHSRTLNNRINKIQERALRIVYDDQLSTVDEPLQKDCSVTVHERNIQMLATEVYKIVNCHAHKIMIDVFKVKENYIFCSTVPFKFRNVRTFVYVTETITYMGTKIWSLIPDDINMEGSTLNQLTILNNVNCG